jgi:tRNA G37 N-methylase Trm5
LEYSFGNDDDDDDYVNSLKLKGQMDYNNSTGITIWLGSEIMFEYLKTHPYLVQGKRVLELGAGLGLSGLTAHRLGAREVLMTDGDTAVLSRLEWNINNNTRKNKGVDHDYVGDDESPTGTVDCRQLIWGQQHGSLAEEKGKFDVICSADCLYMPQSVYSFWETARTLIRDDGILLYVMVAASQASPDDIFGAASDFGFTWSCYDFNGKPVYTFQLEKRD